ncbi:C6 zinc finger domain protein [Aspergillus ellipticus CBS 707.79]|uniref:C6 zinc finger domain protein n=1 Tax=Aspergillus ellipticus CBS 707.79 TaxID=1448320 RepID=A0A319DUU9_9EURO|nr:C6 zinc finger domain protein [Aspergillus ellipticus CBS 707.79]
MYRGKISTGCALCRKRRLRCDRRRPSCAQCLRVDQVCSGYRDPDTLRFYDQSAEVASKAQARSRAGRGPTKTLPAQESPSTPPVIYSLISDDQRAMTYVIPYYIGTDQHRGLLAFLPSLMKNDPSPALKASAKAIGLLGMTSMPHLKSLARQEYSIGLCATNCALRNPKTATSDSTLGAVLLLGLYELITSRPTGMSGGWKNHAHGAARLLELRGEKQLNSPVGLELFTVVRFQNAISNVFFRLGSRIHNSPTIAALSKISMSKRNEHTRPIETLYGLLIEMSNIAIEVDEAHLHNDLGRQQLLIEKSLLLDASLQAWTTSLTPAWSYTIIDDPPSHLPKFTYPPIYDGRYHIYHSVSIVTMWNNYRQTRIVLNEMIRNMALRWLGLQYSPQYQQIVSQSARIIDLMACDICDSVPYYFISGEVGFGSIYRVMWPLFIAGRCAAPGSPAKEWTTHILDQIGNLTGIQQAVGMSQLLRQKNPASVIPGADLVSESMFNRAASWSPASD